MSVDTCFKPIGPTTLVVNSALQVVPPGQAQGGIVSYRIRNMAAAAQYFAWGATSGVTVAAPSAGTPSPNTIGMLASSVETFEIPQGVFFIASSATGFEVTPGQGN